MRDKLKKMAQQVSCEPKETESTCGVTWEECSRAEARGNVEAKGRKNITRVTSKQVWREQTDGNRL